MSKPILFLSVVSVVSLLAGAALAGPCQQADD